ncbi:monocarboxylate transporter 12-B-like [Panulirus ornatus]|uniref:monocarboxylate transporter 12-B-like n=1 Tax=Panulirus ornatus TaxID=150431 RepID=UPI003A8B59FA
MTSSQKIQADASLSRGVGVAKIFKEDLRYEKKCQSRDLRQNGDRKQKLCDVGDEAEDDVWEMRPPDGGWGWMVVLGSFIIMTLIPMMTRCFGVIFSPYLLQEGSSSTTAAWVFNTQCFIWNAMGPITRPLTKEFGWRKVGITGAALASVSLMISAFTPSPAFLFFSYSLLSGSGGGMVICICLNIVHTYFDRRRGKACAITSAGISVGPMVGAPLVRLLQDEYGFRGAALILGALVLHSCVGASFFHPVEWHLKKAHPQVTDQTREVDAFLTSPKESKPVVSEGLVDSTPELSFTKSLREPDSEMRGRGGRRISETSWSSWQNSSLAASVSDVATVAEAEQVDEISSTADSRDLSSIGTVIRRVAQSTVSDLRVLRSPRACIIALGGCLCISGYFNFMMMVPFAMQAAGHTIEDAAWCLSVASICNLVMRLVVSVLSDWPRFNMQRCYMAGFTVISFAAFIFPFLTDLTNLLATMALFGCGVGTAMGLYNLVMIDVMGLENLAPVLGSSWLTVGIGFILLGPLIGFVRDVSNSYALSMWMVAGMLLTSFTLWLFMPAAVRYDQRRSEEEEQQELNRP